MPNLVDYEKEREGLKPMQTIVPMRSIVIGENRRELKNIAELAASIEQLGLINPITVSENMMLIAGYHRFTACTQLGWTDIPVNIIPLSGLDLELAEIDENLIRNDLTVLGRFEE